MYRTLNTGDSQNQIRPPQLFFIKDLLKIFTKDLLRSTKDKDLLVIFAGVVIYTIMQCYTL